MALDESFFRVRFDRLTPVEKRYLRAMAEWSRRYRSGLTRAAEHVNSAYLKSQGQALGIKSYGAMVDLLVDEAEMTRSTTAMIVPLGSVRGKPRPSTSTDPYIASARARLMMTTPVGSSPRAWDLLIANMMRLPT